ncbi:MAG: hypothetical protein ACLUFE_13815 [Anaerostipes hadrus]
MKKKWIAAVVGLVVVLGASIGIYKYNAYAAKEKNYVVEYGDKLSTDPADYIAGNETALENTKLDLSRVDTSKVGTYQAYATYKDKTVQFKVKVQDSKNPEITLNDVAANIIVNRDVNASDLVKSVTDKSGIKSIQFSRCDIKKEDVNELSKYTLSFPKAGENKIEVVAEDNNGNQSMKEVTVKVTEDYLKHVKGFRNFKVIKGNKADWMKGIKKDKLIKSIQADDSKVKLKKVGKYKLVYKITGSNDTVVTKTVKVTVKNKPVTTVARSNSYSNSTGTTGRSYRSGSTSSSYGKRSSTGSTRRSSRKSNSGRKSSKGTYDDLKPGQSWNIKYRERNVDIGNGSTADSFDW